MSKKILLVGAGPTSSLIAYNLKQVADKFKHPLEIHLWEKSKGTGGRFSTSRSPYNANCIADLGAQYLTQTRSNAWSKPYFECLSENGLIRKFEPNDIPGFKQTQGKDNFVCTQGTASIVKFFFNQSNVTCTHFNRKAVTIRVNECNGLRRIEVTGEEHPNDNQIELFDVVILTIPAPQILQLQNADELVSNAAQANLSRVTYTSRYALGLFYDAPLELKSGEKPLNYLENDTALRYWAIENEKRKLGLEDSPTGRNKDDNTSVVIHTTVQFGAVHVEKSLSEMEKVMLDHIDGKIKTIEGFSPQFVKCHKWRYSQVDKGYLDSPGFIELFKSPTILAAGDGFTYSGFEGCILSAEKTVQQLIADIS